MEQQNDEQVKSYVQEFAEMLRNNNHENVWNAPDNNRVYFKDKQWWYNLGNEMELLLERSKLLDEIMSDIKERHKTEENGKETEITNP